MSMRKKNDQKKPLRKSNRREEPLGDDFTAEKRNLTERTGPDPTGSPSENQSEGYGPPAYGEFAQPDGFEESHSGERKENAAGGVHGQEGYGWERPGGIRPEGLEEIQPDPSMEEEDRTDDVNDPPKSGQAGTDKR